ncbi:MAG: UvrD-helicase domain-containing protein [Caldilineales bacterium]|nr:UvrD-helicase domain-containing protein [Caldilineales bacterium]
MSFINTLNPAQQQAVRAASGPVLVLAGPGSGKTRVLTYRIAYLIKELGVDPWRILAVTFTNKAADEMRARTETMLGLTDGLRGLTLGTFHRVCARFLRIEAEAIGMNPRYVIFDSDDQMQVIKQAMRDLEIDEKRNHPRAIQSRISTAKNELFLPDEFPTQSYFDEIAVRVYERYQQLLEQSSAVDFDDLLMKTVFMLRDFEPIREKYQRKFEYILVDEFQDTNTAQYELVRLLGGGYRNIFVVGDEDQSIYRFRGADFRNVARFREDYPDANVILLEQNYRSTQTILDAANAVIKRNRHRVHKELFTDRGDGAKITIYQAYDEHDEGNFILDEITRLDRSGEVPPGECAVMYRTNAQSRAIEEAFVRRGVPYRLVGATRFYNRKEVKDMMSYLRLVRNPDDDVSMRRVINVPPRRIGATSLNRLGTWAASIDISLYNALRLLGGDAEPELQQRAPKHPFNAGALSAFMNFYGMLQDWRQASAELTPSQLLDRILDESGYRDWLRDGTDEGEDRWNNVQELRTVSAGYDAMDLELALDAFLEEVALVSDTDDYEGTAGVPTLLTLHSAKGLEFGAVFIIGVEDGFLPHNRSFEDTDEMVEERRLAYVGITRAKDRLYLLHAFRRGSWGGSDMAERSRFLDDLPRHLIGGNSQMRDAHRRATTWGNDRRRTSSIPPLTRLQFRPGQAVMHPIFGDGIVITSKRSGDDEEVAVAFPQKGIKRLLASVANLTIESE